jgi:hypothetical protein
MTKLTTSTQFKTAITESECILYIIHTARLANRVIRKKGVKREEEETAKATINKMTFL